MAYRQTCDDEAHRLVFAHWSAVEALAQPLIDSPNRQIPGAQVAQLVAAAGGCDG